MYEISYTKIVFRTQLLYRFHQISILLKYILTIEEMKSLINATCPACKSITELVNPPQIGQQIICSVCNVLLVIVWLYPISLDFALPEDQLEHPATNQIEIKKEDNS